jgi:hypothetical protein
MTRKFRTFLFTFFVLLFLVAAPALVLYAQGYRLNWPPESGKKLIVKTGAFNIKTYPKQADVFIDDKLINQTDFFFSSAFVENLMPRQYRVQVKKTGYQTWEKNLQINEKGITEARNITLFPTKIGFSPVEDGVSGILLSPDGQKIALRQATDNGWNLRLYDVAQGVTLKLADQNSFTAKGSVFKDWKWSDAKTLGVTASSGSATTTWNIAIDKNPARISRPPAVNATTTPRLAEQKDNGGYYIATDGFIYKNGQREASKAVAAPIAARPGAEYGLWVFDDFYFVKVGAELHVLKPGENAFEKILDGLAGEPKISPDGRKAAFNSESEIWVMYLKEKSDQPAAVAGQKVFIARLSEKIANCDWFNSDYLLFTSGDAIKTVEIDSRDKVNITQLAKISDVCPDAKGAKPQIIFNSNQKTIYLFASSIVYKSDPIQ